MWVDTNASFFWALNMFLQNVVHTYKSARRYKLEDQQQQIETNVNNK
jgi:hypothetical protein